MEKAKKAGCEIVLPTDAVVASEFKQGAPSTTVPVDRVPADKMILDVGPNSISDLSGRLRGLKTLMWNGPLGSRSASIGTNAVARERPSHRQNKLMSVAAAATPSAWHAGVEETSYISTAGGAFLEWLEGKTLPASRCCGIGAG
jgi:phosphoglycerate kinase